MSKKRFVPKTNVTHTLARNRPHFIGKECHNQCGVRFTKDSSVVILDIQTSWHRGDDEVNVYCPECYAKKEREKVDE